MNALPLSEPLLTILSLLAAILVASITIWEFNRLDKERSKWQFGKAGKSRHMELDNLYDKEHSGTDALKK